MPISPHHHPIAPRLLRRAVCSGLSLLVLALVLAGCGSSTKVVTDTTATGGAGTGSSGTTTTGGVTSTGPAGTDSTPASTTSSVTTGAPVPTTATSTGARTTTRSTGGASPSSTSTAAAPGTSTRTTAATPYEASCGGTFKDVSGLSCGHALPVMNAWDDSQSCEISDQYGSPTSSRCSVEGYACSADLGYPPGQTEGERSAIVSCTGADSSLSFIRGT